MERKLKDYIDIRWHVDDVLYCMQNLIEDGELDDSLSYDEALEVLHYLDAKHDCNFGITWDVIEMAIRNYLEKKEKKQ